MKASEMLQLGRGGEGGGGGFEIYTYMSAII